MSINNRKPISGLLSNLLKKSLTRADLMAIAEKFDVHHNTIINIRDRKKKEPDKSIVKDMIKTSIRVQKNKIKTSTALITQLEDELKKIKTM
ncbi:hypothetical protein [Aquimarina algicola]|uniref:Uncharacterized protein n=1 Tax=Aquimarina algicola TaxID=2589995 RepID=A0A504J7J7_9FLAO|nr:hypothetical protein [Aquimarina algicola]TPN83858.1 hypothetical protein FHK87_17990 [Aquimarina algicola]